MIRIFETTEHLIRKENNKMILKLLEIVLSLNDNMIKILVLLLIINVI